MKKFYSYKTHKNEQKSVYSPFASLMLLFVLILSRALVRVMSVTSRPTSTSRVESVRIRYTFTSPIWYEEKYRLGIVLNSTHHYIFLKLCRRRWIKWALPNLSTTPILTSFMFSRAIFSIFHWNYRYFNSYLSAQKLLQANQRLDQVCELIWSNSIKRVLEWAWFNQPNAFFALSKSSRHELIYYWLFYFCNCKFRINSYLNYILI